jgi:phosphocarrier protein
MSIFPNVYINGETLKEFHMIAKQKGSVCPSKEGNTTTQACISTARGFFIIINDKGLHTRPSTELVKCATSFRAQITLYYQDFVVNAKSLLGILTLAASCGSRIEIEAVGEDATEAVATLIELARNKFYIHY